MKLPVSSVFAKACANVFLLSGARAFWSRVNGELQGKMRSPVAQKDFPLRPCGGVVAASFYLSRD